MPLGTMIRSIKRGDTLLVTPKVEQFLYENPDGVIWDEEGHALFTELVKRTFGANNMRKGRFGASSRGKCQRAQLWKYMGMPETKIIDPETLNLFNDGKWRHLRWQMMAMQAGALTHVEYPLKMTKYRLTSSVDGLHSIDSWLFELKGDRQMSRLLNTPSGVVEEHNLQIHTMFLMTGWETCSYVMEDKSTQQWREKIVRRDPAIIRLVVQEMEELNEHVDHRSLPEPLSACKAKEGPYKRCPFAKPCIDRWERGIDHWPVDEDDWFS